MQTPGSTWQNPLFDGEPGDSRITCTEGGDCKAYISQSVPLRNIADVVRSLGKVHAVKVAPTARKGPTNHPLLRIRYHKGPGMATSVYDSTISLPNGVTIPAFSNHVAENCHVSSEPSWGLEEGSCSHGRMSDRGVAAYKSKDAERAISSCFSGGLGLSHHTSSKPRTSAVSHLMSHFGCFTRSTLDSVDSCQTTPRSLSHEQGPADSYFPSVQSFTSEPGYVSHKEEHHAPPLLYRARNQDSRSSAALWKALPQQVSPRSGENNVYTAINNSTIESDDYDVDVTTPVAQSVVVSPLQIAVTTLNDRSSAVSASLSENVQEDDSTSSNQASEESGEVAQDVSLPVSSSPFDSAALIERAKHEGGLMDTKRSCFSGSAELRLPYHSHVENDSHLSSPGPEALPQAQSAPPGVGRTSSQLDMMQCTRIPDSIQEAWSHAHAKGLWHGRTLADLNQLCQDWEALKLTMENTRRSHSSLPPQRSSLRGTSVSDSPQLTPDHRLSVKSQSCTEGTVEDMDRDLRCSPDDCPFQASADSCQLPAERVVGRPDVRAQGCQQCSDKAPSPVPKLRKRSFLKACCEGTVEGQPPGTAAVSVKHSTSGVGPRLHTSKLKPTIARGRPDRSSQVGAKRTSARLTTASVRHGGCEPDRSSQSRVGVKRLGRDPRPRPVGVLNTYDAAYVPRHRHRSVNINACHTAREMPSASPGEERGGRLKTGCVVRTSARSANTFWHRARPPQKLPSASPPPCNAQKIARRSKSSAAVQPCPPVTASKPKVNRGRGSFSAQKRAAWR